MEKGIKLDTTNLEIQSADNSSLGWRRKPEYQEKHRVQERINPTSPDMRGKHTNDLAIVSMGWESQTMGTSVIHLCYVAARNSCHANIIALIILS